MGHRDRFSRAHPCIAELRVPNAEGVDHDDTEPVGGGADASDPHLARISQMAVCIRRPKAQSDCPRSTTGCLRARRPLWRSSLLTTPSPTLRSSVRGQTKKCQNVAPLKRASVCGRNSRCRRRRSGPHGRPPARPGRLPMWAASRRIRRPFDEIARSPVPDRAAKDKTLSHPSFCFSPAERARFLRPHGGRRRGE